MPFGLFSLANAFVAFFESLSWRTEYYGTNYLTHYVGGVLSKKDDHVLVSTKLRLVLRVLVR